MPALVRVGDICSGHGCWPPRPCLTGSPNVRANGLPLHRLGDSWAFHCKPCGKNPACHDAVLVRASSTIRINGIPAARVGDPLSCGSVCSTGSPTVGGGK
jgi:uncharacterized Zn-binding protein involved in type VI secretion